MLFKYFFILLFPIYLFSFERIIPIPLTVEYDKEKAELGKNLFFDPILSNDGTLSCNSCHQLPGSGADDKVFSRGINNQMGMINTPTVLNSRYNFVQFWNGRVESLHEQALMPILNPQEMGSSVEQAIQKLEKSYYKSHFDALFKDGITKKNIAEVIAEFEKALITPNARFDKYLRGDKQALSVDELKGYEVFKSLGCISCHNGINIGGNMFQKIGIMIPYDHTTDDKSIEGRFEVTGRSRDRAVFKVPTLRNIELTAPYLHDGSALTLKDAVLDMREHQLGVLGEDEDIKYLVAFLKTLTGETPEILSDMK